MSGTAIYRALVHAGAPEEEAKEAANIFDNNIEAINERLNKLEVMISEVRVTNRILIALILAVLIKSFF